MLLLRMFCAFVILATVSMTCAEEQTGSELVDLVIGLLQDKDKDVRSLALEQVRTEAKGATATKRFAAELQNLSTEAQVGLLSALADRGDRVAQPAVLGLLKNSQDASVRIAAINALGSIGDSSDLERLVRMLDKGSSAEQTASRLSLVRLGGETLPAKMARLMNSSSPELKIKLIDVLTTRRALETIPTILDAAIDKNEGVRKSAMSALGKIAGAEHVPGMVQGVLRAKTGSERAAAEKAIMFVCARIPEKDKRADPLLSTMDKLSASQRMTMLTTLGRVGGTRALKIVSDAIAKRDSAMHSAGIRALINWPDASVAAQLIDLAKNDNHQSHRIAALRALIRVSPLPDGRTDAEKLKLLQTAMSMSNRDSEKIYALRRASAIRIVATLRFVLPYLDKQRYAQQACETIVELAHHRGLREPNKDEFHKALDRVIEISKNDTVIDRANRYKKDQTWVRPKK